MEVELLRRQTTKVAVGDEAFELQDVIILVIMREGVVVEVERNTLTIILLTTAGHNLRDI